MQEKIDVRAKMHMAKNAATDLLIDDGSGVATVSVFSFSFSFSCIITAREKKPVFLATLCFFIQFSSELLMLFAS